MFDTPVLHNVIASGYVTFYQINKFFENLLIFQYLQNVLEPDKNGFAVRIWPMGRSLETLL